MQVLLLLLFVAVVIVLAVASHQARAARRAELTALAQRRGWRFDPEDDSEFPKRFVHFGLFAPGHSRRIFNTLAGRAQTRFGAMDFQMGDYRYTTGSGKHQHTHRLSYLLVHLPFPLPRDAQLLVRPEHFGDSLGAMVGFDDIDFESEEFSRQYFVKSNDRKFAYEVIHPRLMEFLLASPCGRLELQGAGVALSGRSEVIWGVPTIEAALAWLQAYVDLWPDYLVQDLKARSAGLG